MASALVIFSLGDAAAQYIEYNQSSSPNIKTTAPPPPKPFQFDLLRMNEMILWSVGFYTPVLYQFYRWMDHRWPKVTPLNVIRKVGGAFLLAAPLNAGFFAYGVAYPYIISTYVTGTRSEIPTEIIKKEAQDKINAELINTMKASASLWWPVNALNFALVPGQFRAIWTSAWSVAWSTYLSLVQHRDFEETDEGAVVKLMRKLTKRDNKQDTGAGVSGCHETWFVQSEQSQFEGAEGERFEQVTVMEDVEEGEMLMEVKRNTLSILPVPAWNTLQISKAEHAVFSSKSLCLNHSSTPNTRIQIGPTIQVYSTVYIPSGAQLTFNYNTTEYVISSPFKDWATGNLVKGFFYLGKEEKMHLIKSGEVSEHVKELWDEYVRRNVRVKQDEE